MMFWYKNGSTYAKRKLLRLVIPYLAYILRSGLTLLYYCICINIPLITTFLKNRD